MRVSGVRAVARAGLVACAALLGARAGCVAPALAGPVLDRVKASNSVACGAEERAGVAQRSEDGTVAGLAVDICRAVAVAVLGPEGRIVFTLMDSGPDFDAVRDGHEDLVFLTGGTIAAEPLADRLLLGPPAYIEPTVLMVPEGSNARTLRDLAGQRICFMIGTGAERAMEAALERDGLEVMRLGFEEDVEMQDAYNVGRCQAIVAEATFLAQVRQDGGVHALKSRILDGPLALDPVCLATGIDDARWSAIASWTLESLVIASVPPSGWTGNGTGPLAKAVSRLGAREGWLSDVTKAVGSYADIWRRNLGDGSPLKLEPGPNAPWPLGLLVTPMSP